LRTPVAAILSISDNIGSGVVNDKQKFIHYGDLIRNQARQLNHLVEQVLRFSATTRKTSKSGLRPLQVADIIDEALQNTASLIASSGVEIQRKTEPNLPMVHADFSALSQCLQNLITNAVKYGGAGKWISVHAEASGEAGSAGEIKITVEDRGIGIDPGDLAHVFEPFYRSPKVAESEVHGAGLGLALAKSFAEAMGGSITVKSEIGKGTAFTVHLTAAKVSL
jgi:signal transduction histidine kinase